MVVPAVAWPFALLLFVVVHGWTGSATGWTDEALVWIASPVALGSTLLCVASVGWWIGRRAAMEPAPRTRLTGWAVLAPSLVVLAVLVWIATSWGAAEGGVSIPPIGVRGLLSLASLLVWMAGYAATALACITAVRLGKRTLAVILAPFGCVLAVAAYLTVDVLIWYGDRAPVATLPLWLPATIVPIGENFIADPQTAYQYPGSSYPFMVYLLLIATTLGLSFVLRAAGSQPLDPAR
jgi:hypothetical protein